MYTRRKFLKNSILAVSSLAFSKITRGNLNENLPNVLIIGDSISIAYTPFVKQILLYKANVYRPVLENGKPENCQGTSYGIKNIDRWLADKNWDIIHFNFGLHDIKHVDPITRKNSKNPEHPQQADLKQYKKNLIAIVKKLKATKATLIFASTTPYPDQTTGPLRKPGMPAKYNKVATKIMIKNGIEINNLHAFVKARMTEIQKPNNVHFTEKGSYELAIKVSERIKENL